MHKLNKLVLLHAIGWYMLSATGCQKEDTGYEDTITPQRIPIEIQMYTDTSMSYEYSFFHILTIKCTPFDVCDFSLDTYATAEGYNLKGKDTIFTSRYSTFFPSYTETLLPKPENRRFPSANEGESMLFSKCVTTFLGFHSEIHSNRNIDFFLRFYQPKTNICYISQRFRLHTYLGKDNIWYGEIKSIE